MHLRPIKRHSHILLPVLVLAFLYSCRSMPDLVLDDPAFRHDMVEAAIDGEQFNITPEDYPEIRILMSDDRSSYRLAGVILAEQADDEMFYSQIAAAALDPEPEVSDRALKIIMEEPEKYRQALRGMLDSDDPRDRAGALELMAGIGGEDQVPLVISFFNDPDPAVRNQAALTVRALTGRENPFLNEALESDDPLVQSVAIKSLGGYGDSRDIEVFAAAFDSSDSTVRREAQLAALRVGEDGLPVLHSLVSDTEVSYRVRISSLDVMQGIRSPGSLQVLMGLLVDDDQRIAAKARSVLGTYGVEAIPALSELYRTSPEDYRAHAVRLMREIGAPSAYPVLAEALDDESAAVRVLAYEALAEAGEDPWPALRQQMESGGSESVALSLSLLMSGPDPRLALDEDGDVNTESLFLMITLAERRAIADYLGNSGASPLVRETVLALKDAWEAGDEFAALEADIASGNDPYLYAWRRRELLSVAAREALKKSFDRLHDYFDDSDPQVLSDARAIRAESRVMELEARELKQQLDAMPADAKARGEARLENYRRSRDFLVRTWEYIIPALQPLADKVYRDRNLDPDALSRESALLD